MTVTVTSMPEGLPAGSDRLASTHIRGVLVALPCFSWCVATHHDEDHSHVEDFNHHGEAVEVTLSNGQELISARLMASPHCGTGDTKVAVDYEGDSAELDATGVENLADQLITAASKLRGLSRVIGGAR